MFILYCKRLRMNSVLWSSCMYFDSLIHLKIKEIKITNLIIKKKIVPNNTSPYLGISLLCREMNSLYPF